MYENRMKWNSVTAMEEGHLAGDIQNRGERRTKNKKGGRRAGRHLAPQAAQIAGGEFHSIAA